MEITQGPIILKVKARQCRVTVLYTFSQETCVLLFYVKPLVRYYYYFYMSDHINAVYNSTSLFITICVGKTVPEGPSSRRDINVKHSQGLNKVLSKDINQIRMTFRLCHKGTSLPRRVAGVSVRQESLRRSRRKYFPEGTPCDSLWETWNLFVLKTSPLPIHIRSIDLLYSLKVWDYPLDKYPNQAGN